MTNFKRNSKPVESSPCVTYKPDADGNLVAVAVETRDPVRVSNGWEAEKVRKDTASHTDWTMRQGELGLRSGMTASEIKRVWRNSCD